MKQLSYRNRNTRINMHFTNTLGTKQITNEMLINEGTAIAPFSSLTHRTGVKASRLTKVKKSSVFLEKENNQNLEPAIPVTIRLLQNNIPNKDIASDDINALKATLNSSQDTKIVEEIVKEKCNNKITIKSKKKPYES